MLDEQNPQIEVAHSTEEMFHILESLRVEGFHTKDIHIMAKNSAQLEAVKWEPDVIIHEAGNWMDQFKSWFTGESAVTEGVKRFDLTDGQTAYYGQQLEQGAIVLYVEQDDKRERLESTDDLQTSRLTVLEPFNDTIDHAERSPPREK